MSQDAIETLVIEADLDLCNKIRNDLQKSFEFIWLIVYLKSPKSSSAFINVMNAQGGQLDKKIADQVIAHARKYHDRIKY